MEILSTKSFLMEIYQQNPFEWKYINKILFNKNNYMNKILFNGNIINKILFNGNISTKSFLMKIIILIKSLLIEIYQQNPFEWKYINKNLFKGNIISTKSFLMIIIILTKSLLIEIYQQNPF